MPRKDPKAFRDSQRKLGLCLYCKAPALNGKTRCQKHADYIAKYNIQYNKLLKKKRSDAYAGR